MASITATPLPALGIVKLIIDWTPQGSDLVNVYRITPDGDQVEVIGSPVRLSGGQAILYDTNAPLDVALSYQATIAQPLVSSDDFARTTTFGWGTDEMGNGYVVANGSPVEFGTNGNHAYINVGSPLGSSRVITLPMNVADGLIEATIGLSAVATGGPYFVMIGGRRSSGTDSYYGMRLSFQTNSTVILEVERRVSGVPTIIGSVTLPGTYAQFSWYRAEFEFVGPRLRARAWTETSTKPSWQLELYDSNLITGVPFYRAVMSGTSTNVLPLTVNYDLTRVTSYTPISLTTAATVELDGDPHGWIRDPQEPARSVRLDDCGTHTFNCLTADRFVFFQGLDEEAYESATGVFSVLDAEHPLTVAQTRKGISTAIRFVSTSLSDIPALRALFSPGRDLVLSLPTKYGWGIDTYGTDAVTFHDVTASRLNRRDQRKPQRMWSAPIRVVDHEATYPTGRTGSNAIPAPGATYGDMEALGSTYSTLRGTVISDTFTRTVAVGSWGTATSGQAWTITTGPATQNQVSGGVGQMMMTDRSGPDLGTRTLIELPTTHTDIDVLVRFRWGITAAGDSQRASVVVRKNGLFYIVVEGTFATSGQGSMRIGQRTGGGTTPYGAPVTVSGLTEAANTWYWLRAQVIGTTVRGRLWQDGVAQPTAWHVTTTTGIASGTSMGLEGFASAFSTNPTPEVLDWDDLQVTFPNLPGARTYLDWSQGVFL